MNKEKLSFKEKLGYFFTAMASDITTQFTGSFLLFFYTTYAGIGAGLASTVIALSVIWDAINDPLIASWTDNHTFKNGERLRPILLWSVFPFAIIFILLFTFPANWSLGGKIAYCFGWYFLYMIPRTFYFLPVFTLRQVATPDVEERLKLNTFVSFGQAFGSALPTIAIWPIIRAIGGGEDKNHMENPQLGFLIGTILIAIILIGSSLFNYFTTKERVKNENKEKMNLFKAMGIVLKDKNFVYNLVLFFFYGMVVTLCTGYALYYCKFVLLDESLATPVSAGFIIGTLLATPFVKKMYDKLGRTVTTVIGSIILLASGAIFFIAPKAPITPYLFTFLIGVGTAITIIVIGMNRAEITDIIEYKQGVRMDGMVSNVSGFIQKMARSLITLALGWLLEWAGFVEKADTQPVSAQKAIIGIMGIGIMISAIIMIISALFINIDKEKRQIEGK